MSDSLETEILEAIEKADYLFPCIEWCSCTHFWMSDSGDLGVIPTNGYAVNIKRCSKGHKYLRPVPHKGIIDKLMTYFDYYLSKIF